VGLGSYFGFAIGQRLDITIEDDLDRAIDTSIALR
jgi:hypothetical protein